MLLSLQGKHPPAILALADGTVFVGTSIGHSGICVGEMVFNTSMTGYQEILTDPSYCQQIVTLTYPHIGNYGTNPEDEESPQVHTSGLVIKSLPLTHSNFRADSDLSSYLKKNHCVAIADIDTRMLTKVLREKGSQNGAILALSEGESIGPESIQVAIDAAIGAPSMSGLDLAQAVSVDNSYEWRRSEWVLGEGYGEQTEPQFHVVAYDFGVKRNILRMLAARGCRVTVVPAQTSAQEVLKLKPNGVFLSNGPGDPGPCGYAISATQTFLQTGLPLFGICLGHQILALASGASTYKMKFGHHGANHPVKDLDNGRVCITSQNHGFAVDEKTLPSHIRSTHISLFDGSLQGLVLKDKPAFSFQGHPEASPGPHDIGYLFDRFIDSMMVPTHA
ncbi:MAG: carbamoyl-phosphate synthase small subunit [Betaproteobacteria bacterium]|nr:carbamoyl-phosphate synthase small subunit [Betaproteobacteria bacterium]NBY34454.1 carbamoyl-phosphate synthase small subunit [Betaproteobacteria bacterium]